jgi:hypothetical protein
VYVRKVTDRRGEKDAAADAGRLAGKLIGHVGARLLRYKPVREAVRRGHDEAVEETDDQPTSS